MKDRFWIIAIISVILIYLLLLIPLATARVTSNKIIQSGDTIYQWERGLDLSQMNTTWRVDRLTYYADITKDETFGFPVSTPTSFNVEDRAGSYVGSKFYLYNNTVGRLPQFVFINNVKLILDIVLDISRDESINGLVITRDTILAITIRHNLEEAHLIPDLEDNNFTLKVDFTSPEGVPHNIFGGQDLSKIRLSGTTSPIIIGGINPINEATGQWKVQAVWLPGTDFAQSQANANSNAGLFNTSTPTTISILVTTTPPKTTLIETTPPPKTPQTLPSTLVTIQETMTSITSLTTPLTIQPTTSVMTSGFEILIAITGLIFVAFLILRR